MPLPPTIALLVTLLTGTPPAQAAPPADPVAIAALAESALARGDAAAAERIARMLAGQGHAAHAEPVLRKLLLREPGAARLQHLIGFCLLSLGRLEEAESLVRQAVAAQPREDGWLHTLALIQGRQRKYASAREWLDRAIALRPRPEYQLARATCAINAGQSGLARADLEAYLRVRADDPEALYLLATVVANQGEDVRALELLRRCVALRPGHLEGRYRLGLAQARTGDASGAAASFEAVLKEVPGHVGAHYNLGRALVKLGRKAEGEHMLASFRELSAVQDEIEHVKDQVLLNPDSVPGRSLLATLLLKAGYAEEALAQLDAAISLQPGDPELHRLRAQALSRSGSSVAAAQAQAVARSLEAGRQ